MMIHWIKHLFLFSINSNILIVMEARDYVYLLLEGTLFIVRKYPTLICYIE